jgi:hypothetical protein
MLAGVNFKFLLFAYQTSLSQMSHLKELEHYFYFKLLSNVSARAFNQMAFSDSKKSVSNASQPLDLNYHFTSSNNSNFCG